jgi:D-tyrosyl-tRNA(Tyr) deacylase
LLVQEVHNRVGQVQTGVFGALMQVMVDNDGPVTIILDLERV